MFKKILSIIISAAILLSFANINAFAENDEKTIVVDMKNTSAISKAGLEADKKIKNTAKYSAKWDLSAVVAGEKNCAKFIPSSEDFSKHSEIEFSVYLDSDENAKIVMILESDNPATADADYYYASLELEAKKWNDFSFKYEDLTRARNPIGFNKISSITFRSSGWRSSFAPGAVCYIDQICLKGSPTSIAGATDTTPAERENIADILGDTETVGDEIFYSNDYNSKDTNIKNGLKIYEKTNKIALEFSNSNGYIKAVSQDDSSACHIDFEFKAKRYMVFEFDLGYKNVMYKGEIQCKDYFSNSFFGGMSFENGTVKFSNGESVQLDNNSKTANIALLYDLLENTVTPYLNKKQLGNAAPLSSDPTSMSLFRFYMFPSQSGANIILDNYKIYEGNTLRDILENTNAQDAPTIDLSDKQAVSLLKNNVALSIYSNYIYYNNEKHQTDGGAYIKDNRTLIPVRAVSEAFGCDVDYNFETQTITIDGKAKIKTGSKDIILPDGSTYTSDIAAEIKNNRAFLPLRALCEQILNKSVTWHDLGVIVIGDNEFNASEGEFKAISNYLLYDRPTDLQITNMLSEKQISHPRIMLSNSDIKSVLENCEKDESAKIWKQNLLSSADETLKKSLPVYDVSSGELLYTSRDVYERSKLLGMAYLLTNDKKYADNLFEVYNAAAKFPDWCPSHFLDVAEMTCAFAIGYDWLYDYLNDSQKKVMEDAIINLSLNCYYDVYYKKSDYGWWFGGNETNWNIVCNGSAVMGALAVFDKNPDLCSKIIQIALRDIESMMQSFYPDGAWMEGTMYFTYAASYLANTISTLDTCFSTDFGLSRAPGLSNAPYYAIASNGPTGINNFHDSSYSPLNTDTLFWFAKKFNDINIAAVRYEDLKTYSPTPLDILWYNPDCKDKTANIFKDYYFRGVEFVSMRENTADKNSTWLSYHAGNAQVNHSHLDCGTFVVDINGVRWAHDIGGDSYSLKGYHDADKHYYRQRPEGHNLYVINPDSSAGQTPSKAFSPVTTLVSNPRGAYSVCDLTPAYKDNATSAIRGFMLSDDRRSATIRDEITLKKDNSVFYWFAHAKGDIQIVDKHTAILTNEGKQVKFMIDSNIPDYEFYVADASPLPTTPVYSGQASNSAYKKLCLKATASGSIYVSCKYIALDDPNANTKIENIPISDWTIPDGETESFTLPELDMIYIDGAPCENFASDRTVYSVTKTSDSTDIPKVSVSAKDNISYKISEAQNFGDDTIIETSFKDSSLPYKKTYIVKTKILPKLLDVNGIKRLQVAAHFASEQPQEDHPASAVSDNNTDDQSRWAASGDGQWVTLDLGSAKPVNAVAIAVMNSLSRQYNFEISVSNDNINFKTVIPKTQTALTGGMQIFDFAETQNVRYVRYTGYQNTENSWNSVTEFAALQK